MKITYKQRYFDVNDTEYVSSNCNKFIKNIIDNQDKVVEHPALPGCYYIPGVLSYLITKDGRLYSLHRSRFLDQPSQKKTRYASYRIDTMEHGTLSLTMGRLMAACFLPKPRKSLEYIQVNHIDGDRQNNHISNLEWVTPTENVVHSIATGLNDHAPRYVERRNINTGEVEVFQSIKKAAFFTGVSIDGVHLRANSMGAKRYDEHYQWRWFTEHGKEWPEVGIRDHSKLGRPILVYDLFRRVEHEFERAVDACKLLVCSPSVISEHINDPSQPIISGMWLVQWKDTFVPWRKIDDPYKEYALARRGNVVIRVTHPESGWIWIFTSATEAADATGCSPTNLQWRLKDKDAGKKVYSNGYTYQYYLDYLGIPRDEVAKDT